MDKAFLLCAWRPLTEKEQPKAVEMLVCKVPEDSGLSFGNGLWGKVSL